MFKLTVFYEGFDGTLSSSEFIFPYDGEDAIEDIIRHYKIGNRRMGDVDQCFAEVSKANNVLNWKSHLSIEDALVSSWNWEKNINNEKL